ncbi:protein FAM136A [Anopheles arabiensis]|uniref:Protein FAM136A n=5 Tax=gambiae species complex TaxID=44542 RepID=A0A6E8VNH0_ANOCL|nr:protein FAM136A [Anopheles arabiensis]XP_040219184.2 protein FAM136A [Anopheles coluzzii]XP_041774170.1 protein FAM136A [Anopheles merus]XP_316022.4 protein FAM136A [Anopheles gambiae]
MIEQQKQRIEMEITKQLDDLDRNVLRKMQADMHDCAARCCKDSVSSMDTVQQCVERCSVPAQRAQQHVETEINSFNSRLQRCVMDCNDTIKDKMGPNPSEGDIAKYTAEFERCAIKCVDKHVAILPNMFASMRKVLQSRSSS